MKLDAPKNLNYAAQVVRVRHITPLANCDNVVGVPVLGYQAIVGKDTQVGDLMLVFTAETQLSTGYASLNNLYRHAELNADPSAKGYLEDNRRVKALKFRGHRSDALLMPLSSLKDFLPDYADLQEGDVFDTINGKEICRKYVVKQKRSKAEMGVGQGRRRREPRVDEKLFPKHFDTPNYARVPEDAIKPEDQVVITQKLHGTSVRIAHTLVQRKLSLVEKVARFFGARVPEREWAYVYGSRNVVKDPGGENPGYYSSDLYTKIGSRLEGLLPKGWIVYGEIVGWVPDTAEPIQWGYTYCIPEGSAWLFVYRVTTINEDGRTVDLSWPAVKEFCESIGVETVPELFSGRRAYGNEVIEYYLDKRYADTYWQALPTDGSMVDEGICIRKEGVTPLIVKAKSPEFLRHETKLLDKEAVDLEAEEVAA